MGKIWKKWANEVYFLLLFYFLSIIQIWEIRLGLIAPLKINNFMRF